MSIKVLTTTSLSDKITNEAAQKMLDEGCPECGDEDTFLIGSSAVNGEMHQVVICDECGHAEVADDESVGKETPTVRTHLEYSTGILTDKDVELLDSAAAETESMPLRTLKYEYGYVVFTASVDPKNPGQMARDCAEVGMSQPFCETLLRAEEGGHMFVVFDQDAG